MMKGFSRFRQEVNAAAKSGKSDVSRVGLKAEDSVRSHPLSLDTSRSHKQGTVFESQALLLLLF